MNECNSIYKILSVATGELSSSNSESSKSSDDSGDSLFIPPKKTKKAIHFYTPRLLAALDKCAVSNRNAVHIISAVIAALGHSIDDYVLSKTTLAEYRTSNREEIAKEKQKNYNVIIL